MTAQAGMLVGVEDIAAEPQPLGRERPRPHVADSGAHVEVAAAKMNVVTVRPVSEDELDVQEA